MQIILNNSGKLKRFLEWMTKLEKRGVVHKCLCFVFSIQSFVSDSKLYLESETNYLF